MRCCATLESGVRVGMISSNAAPQGPTFRRPDSLALEPVKGFDIEVDSIDDNY